MQRSTPQLGRPTSAGFSLVELVIVMVIIGVIAAIALPRFAQATARQQLDAAERRIMSDLERAQRTAKATSNAVSVKFEKNSDRYTFTPVVGSSFVVELDESPYQVEISKATFGGSSTVTFNGFGIPNSAGTVTIKSSEGRATITLDESGAVSR